ncbi:MAG: glycosyltransferase [Gammaproteobacteria bacterium]|nr:glycosyltransferase [Gammaproteobacteria bacterium]
MDEKLRSSPLISVIVRTQNRPNLLEQALSSIAAQTYAPVEAVIVNDGGKDVSAIVNRLEPLISGGAKLIRHPAVKGRSAAANSGLEAASGEWAAFLDDDDVLETDGLAALAGFIPWDKDVIYGNVQVLQMAREKKEERCLTVFDDPFNADRLLLQNYIPICAYICKREQALAIGGFDCAFDKLEDWDFLFRLAAQASFHHVSKLVASYRVWGEAFLTGKEKEQGERYQISFYEKHRDALNPHAIRQAFLAVDGKHDRDIHRMSAEKLELRARYDTQVHELNLEHTRVLQGTQAEYEHAKQQLQARHEHEKQQLQARHEHEKQQLQAAGEQTSLQCSLQLKAEHELQLSEEQGKIQDLREELAGVQAQLLHTQNQVAHAQNQVAHEQNQAAVLGNALGAETRLWQKRMHKLLWRISSHMMFSADVQQDLSRYGFSPLLRLLAEGADSVEDIVPCLAGVETPLPVLRDKTYRWSFTWHKPSSTRVLFLRLGTCGRINQCQLRLSVFQEEDEEDEEKRLCATATLDGADVRNNEFTAFFLDKPLTSHHYICELTSPDADNVSNTLNIWLTVDYKKTGSRHMANYRYVPPDRSGCETELKRFIYRPLISVLVPVYNTPERYLKACLNSVAKQIYPNWELCIADDASPQPEVRKTLETWQKRFPDQVKISYRKINGHISMTSNTALALAAGEYTVLLDHDDLLAEDALFEAVKCINQNPDDVIDLIYSDEDKLEEDGSFDEPYFKPDWSPELLKGQMYICHMSAYRTALLKELGGFRKGMEGSQDWDLALRFTEQSYCIQHIPKILYHWRKHSDSTAGNIDQKQYADTAGFKAVTEALQREGQGGRAEFNRVSHCLLVRYPVAEKPLVSIIIPNKDMAKTLKSCLDSLCKDAKYKNREIIIVDNGSREKTTFRLYRKYRKRLGDDRFKVCREKSEFSFSRMVNQGVQASKGELILLLNNDTELIGPADWLEEMAGYALRKEIACVGAKLLYPDNTIQHAGVICGIGGVANHSHLNFPGESVGYFGRLSVTANYSAVTGACLMIKRSLWDAVAGFDEELAVAFNDVDFCLKFVDKGYRNIVLPHVSFFHHESKSRGRDDTPSKRERFVAEVEKISARWKPLLEADPYYNPHLTRKAQDFSLAETSPYYWDEEELQ